MRRSRRRWRMPAASPDQLNAIATSDGKGERAGNHRGRGRPRRAAGPGQRRPISRRRGPRTMSSSPRVKALFGVPRSPKPRRWPPAARTPGSSCRASIVGPATCAIAAHRGRSVTVHFIGAGPGAADLITVRGRDLLARCPVCLYAGSIVLAGAARLLPARRAHRRYRAAVARRDRGGICRGACSKARTWRGSIPATFRS